MSAVTVGKLFVASHTSQSTSGFTQERSPMNDLNVENLSPSALVLSSIVGSILVRNLLSAKNVGKPFAPSIICVNT